MLKAVILIGGPQKGTRFRPLSLDIPKPLFPVAGLPLIQHHIEACLAIKGLREILIIGFYPVSQIQPFASEMQQLYNITVKYLQEYVALGTAGGLYHFRDQIRFGNPEAFFVMNGDVCSDFPLLELYQFHKAAVEKSDKTALVTIMGTEATRHQSLNYGCIVTNRETFEVTHYVEKPSSYVSTLINCGVYVFSPEIFNTIGAVHMKQQEQYSKNYNGNGYRDTGYIELEQEIIAPLAGSGQIYALPVTNWWSQLKTAGSAIYANRHYLQLYRTKHPERLCASGGGGDTCVIYPDVLVDKTASIHPTAVLGPNVSIGPGVTVGSGVRIRESIVLTDATIEEHSLVLHSIIGRGSRVGRWARVEGTPSDPDPNKPFAKMENLPLFNRDGKLNPSITILGCSVSVPSETILLNSIVLPNKELARSIKNEIIL
ncbi:mannose-1-phosphate guanyltransferase alpha-A [Diorhabda sublineata]|uniref:mannose-1-phosphate guanyltransferase alpha-A n=1 Tax=Diorhabda sublineata TaxID=1163346 RepID=UPI0024E0AF6B|nr:mannose-1-phosphate guanyltransferase alpha-A [Diorhabda sublineata]